MGKAAELGGETETARPSEVFASDTGTDFPFASVASGGSKAEIITQFPFGSSVEAWSKASLAMTEPSRAPVSTATPSGYQEGSWLSSMSLVPSSGAAGSSGSASESG